LQEIRWIHLSKLGCPIKSEGQYSNEMGVSFAACVPSRTALIQPAVPTITFTQEARPAVSATRSCRTRIRSKATWPNTWAVLGVGAIGLLQLKPCLGIISRLQNVEKNRRIPAQPQILRIVLFLFSFYRWQPLFVHIYSNCPYYSIIIQRTFNWIKKILLYIIFHCYISWKISTPHQQQMRGLSVQFSSITVEWK
jgi:hypothetical protein